jgi:hypothetical protein
LEDPVSFDYKSLQTVVWEPHPAEEPYCPECGQPLTLPSTAPVAQPSSGPLWSWGVIAVGIYLVVAALLRAWYDDHLVVFTRAYVSDTHLAVLSAQSASAAKQLPSDTPRQLNRDLLVGAGGLALVVLGLGSGARRRLGRGHAASNGVARALLGLWGTGEALGGAAASVVLLTFGYLVESELGGGQPLALAVLTSAASRTFNVLVEIVRVVLGA